MKVSCFCIIALSIVFRIYSYIMILSAIINLLIKVLQILWIIKIFNNKSRLSNAKM